MNRKETAQILKILKSAYPNMYSRVAKIEAKEIIALWQDLFDKDNFSDVMKAVKLYIVTDKKGRPPSIGMIKQKMSEIEKE